MKIILVTMMMTFLTACAYDPQEAKGREAEHASKVTSGAVDPDAQYDLSDSNRGQGLWYAAKVDYFFDPRTGYCFAAVKHDRSLSIATVSCDKVKHRILNPPSEWSQQ